jgi:bifunctional DNA-binding transcriptional regulator/antitoxin component of YhaV-PrlF toxin-antitoxin module
MTKYVVSMDGRGRIQLPEELRKSIGWRERQWYSVEQTEDGLTIRLAEGPEPADAIMRFFSAQLQPLGDGRGEGHNQYVSRWRHASGAVLVSENGQPNIWMTEATAKRVTQNSLPGTSEIFAPGADKPGFHSNVASTPGLKGETVVKFRAEGAIEAQRLASMILDNLEKHP